MPLCGLGLLEVAAAEGGKEQHKVRNSMYKHSTFCNVPQILIWFGLVKIPTAWHRGSSIGSLL